MPHQGTAYAGRASAVDMGKLLATILSPPPEWRDEVAMLTTPLVKANGENAWGAGIGIQQIDNETTLLHWGVNFPGYQALMLGRPATGDGIVILSNGGPMMFSSGGMRGITPACATPTNSPERVHPNPPPEKGSEKGSDPFIGKRALTPLFVITPFRSTSIQYSRSTLQCYVKERACVLRSI